MTDPNVDSAAAALNVHVGHYSDPEVGSYCTKPASHSLVILEVLGSLTRLNITFLGH